VVRSDGDDDGLVLHALVLEVGGDRGAERHGDVEPAVAQVGEQRCGGVLERVQAQRGVALGERGGPLRLRDRR
jgi:hypothetical protein